MAVHTGEKTFKCDTCDRSFVDKDNLIKHIKTHTHIKTLLTEMYLHTQYLNNYSLSCVLDFKVA
jgi:uncharacterized Zn-finger protein